jgi:hypothetical protein
LKPWGPADAIRFTKRAKTPAAKRKWARIADSVLLKTSNEGMAIRTANASLRRGKRKWL